jgi:hypothetical protein
MQLQLSVLLIPETLMRQEAESDTRVGLLGCINSICGKRNPLENRGQTSSSCGISFGIDWHTSKSHQPRIIPTILPVARERWLNWWLRAKTTRSRRCLQWQPSCPRRTTARHTGDSRSVRILSLSTRSQALYLYLEAAQGQEVEPLDVLHWESRTSEETSRLQSAHSWHSHDRDWQ